MNVTVPIFTKLMCQEERTEKREREERERKDSRYERRAEERICML